MLDYLINLPNDDDDGPHHNELLIGIDDYNWPVASIYFDHLPYLNIQLEERANTAEEAEKKLINNLTVLSEGLNNFLSCYKKL